MRVQCVHGHGCHDPPVPRSWICRVSDPGRPEGQDEEGELCVAALITVTRSLTLSHLQTDARVQNVTESVSSICCMLLSGVLTRMGSDERHPHGQALRLGAARPG